MKNYDEFLDSKRQLDWNDGFEPLWLPDSLFDFQLSLTEWAIRKGRAALFADCGMGKTLMQLVWAENIVRKTGKNVLILTPLAVHAQTIREAEKFGIEARCCRDGKVKSGINITNYQRIHLLNSSDFIGCVCDESSILKSFDGQYKAMITEFMRRMPYRLLASATAAPNDYIELGTSSEALGDLGYMDMLTRFFVNCQNNSSHRLMQRSRFGHVDAGDKWRFKGHAEDHFWRWVCSWARAIRRPSDLGFDDEAFVLPPLVEKEHIVHARTLPDGFLFSVPAEGLAEQRDERRRTLSERCEKAASLVTDTGEPALVWCNLNPEGDLLSELIPDAVQVSGSDSDDAKEERLLAFAEGKIRVLVTKPKIGAWGLNFQNCGHVVYFPSHSYEQYYQGIRRCWRFGRKGPVRVDVVASDGEINILKNLQRKARQCNYMFDQLVANMANTVKIEKTTVKNIQTEVPSWL